MTTTTRAAGADDLLGAVAAIGPVLREHAADAERARRLAPPAIAALRDAGLFRMLLPRSLGGLETDPVTFALTVEAVARHDAAAAWALQAGNVGDWFGARLPDEGAEEILGGDPDALQAAAFHPPVEGTTAEGGVRVSGRRPLASTIHDARWVLLTAIVEGAPVAAVLPVDEVGIVDTWDSLGMRGTDSNDVVVEDAFVPAHRTFAVRPDAPLSRHHQGPLYRMPAVSILGGVIAPIALGIAREAIEALRELAPGKMALGTTRALRDRSVAHAALGRAEGLVRSARAYFYAAMEEVWADVAAGRAPTLEQRAGALLAPVQAVRACVEAVDIVYGLAGSGAVYERSPVERHFRDAQTIRHHGFVCENRFEAVGQVLLGLDPEFVFVAF